MTKRILLDLRLSNPYSGIGIVTSKFLEFLKGTDFDIHVILNENEDQEEFNHFPNIKLKSVYSPLDQMRLYYYMKRTKPDYVIFPHYFVNLFIPARVKVISFVHDIMAISCWKTFWGKAGFLKSRVLKYFLRFALKDACILVPSYAVKKEVEQFFGYSSLVVPNGRSNDTYLQDTDIHVEKKGNYIYVGNLRPHKNVQFLLRVFEQNSNDSLIIISKDEIDSRQNVRTYHKVDKKQLQSLLEESEALIVPSFSEGFCIPIVDALGEGTKVFANRINVFKDFYGLEITFFNAKNEEELSFLLKNNALMSTTRIFTSYFRSQDLFNWQELKYFLENL